MYLRLIAETDASRSVGDSHPSCLIMFPKRTVYPASSCVSENVNNA